jgi:hypothetical protein
VHTREQPYHVFTHTWVMNLGYTYLNIGMFIVIPIVTHNKTNIDESSTNILLICIKKNPSIWYVIIEILYFHFMTFKNDQIQGLFDN